MVTQKCKQLVYVVDNDDAVRDSLRALLESAGFETILFHAGEDFLGAAEELVRGCVLLDIRLSKSNGITVLESLNARRRDMPVILITGHRHLADRARANKVDAFAVLDKPINEHALLPLIERALKTCNAMTNVLD